VHALLSPQRLNVEAIYAAPFHNRRSSGPADGMEKSYEEIQRLLALLGRSDTLVFRGSQRWLTEVGDSAPSHARDDLIQRVSGRPDDKPLYVIAIGAITNIASAIAAAPGIRSRIVVLWLGGQPLYWRSAHEFNLAGDAVAARYLLDSGVPLVLFPCSLVAESLRTTLPELERHLWGQGPVAGYLCDIFRKYEEYDLSKSGASKVIWDLAPVAWLIDRAMVETSLAPSPVLTESCTWATDPARHPVRIADHVNRDRVFGDLFAKVNAIAELSTQV
jgi:inosine-uridine nucleoside N-ribohydrolase